MNDRIRLAALLAAIALCAGEDALACGDKFLVAGRGTRYQRPKDARAASVLIYADPASGLPAALKGVSVDSVLQKVGHRATTVETLEQLSAILAGGRYDVILAASNAVAALEKLLGKGPDAPVVVALCIPGSNPEPADAAKASACGLKAPPKPRSLLEAIDRAVAQRDQNARRAVAHS
jgi:hypothetical protein